jgi:hypothetical protein
MVRNPTDVEKTPENKTSRRAKIIADRDKTSGGCFRT